MVEGEGRPQEALQKPPLDAVLVFGQGPVLNKASRVEGNADSIPGTDDVNFWSHTLAEATAELVTRKQAQDVIVMGGKTGGPNYKSEADLIADDIISLSGIEKNRVKLEDKSGNTLENIVNLLNLYIDEPEGQGKTLGLVAASYHLSRVKQLMELFDIPYNAAFSAEEVVRFAERTKEHKTKVEQETSNKKLNELEDRMDINSSFPRWKVGDSMEEDKEHLYPPHTVVGPATYFDKQKGTMRTEKKTVHLRIQEEDAFSRFLLDTPEYWIMYVGRLKNGERMRTILGKMDASLLQERFGVSLDVDDTTLREKLMSIPRVIPDMQKTIESKWPEDTKNALEEMVDRRNAASATGAFPKPEAE